MRDAGDNFPQFPLIQKLTDHDSGESYKLSNPQQICI